MSPTRLNNTARILLTMCGTALNFFAIATWAFAVSAHGSIWLLVIAFLGLMGSIISILDYKPRYSDQEILLLAIFCSSLSPFIAAGCWLFSSGTDNSNWVLVLFLLSSFAPIYGCRKLGSRISLPHR
jgi:hypothetical protein